MLFRSALALALLTLPAAADQTIAAFEGEDAAAGWEAKDGSVRRDLDNVHDGSGALFWEAKDEGAVLSTTRLKGDVTEIRSLHGWIRLAGTAEREIVARIPARGGVFWRRFTVRPGVWSEIVLPLYQFRATGTPRWTDVTGLEFVARRSLVCTFDTWVAQEGGSWPAIEPNVTLEERVFGSVRHSMALTENFRVFTDAPINARDTADRLEAGLVRFRVIFGTDEPLDWPVTLIIRKSADDYRRTAVDTARDVYAGELTPPSAGGFTFLDYSFSSFDERAGALRPVFLHEACHQLVSRLLDFRGENGATWVEEGICYVLQNDFTPIEGAKGQALELLGDGKRAPLSAFDGALKISTGPLNMQSFLVMRFILKGPHAGKWADLREALRENKLGLLASVEEAWGIKPADFEKEWEEFTRKWADEK